MPDYRQEDADELHRVSGAVFGAWHRNSFDGPVDRVPGILERMERLETAVRYGLAAAGALGAVGGSLVTLVVQHLMQWSR